MKEAGEQRKQLRTTDGEWQWRKRYRIWNANRKIFLYPENWIERTATLPFAAAKTRLRFFSVSPLYFETTTLKSTRARSFPRSRARVWAATSAPIRFLPVNFFDEADALFGKRVAVHDSHDRYANVEINYLLKRIEEYAGVAILATSKRTRIDNAFSRRCHFVIRVPPRRKPRRHKSSVR